MEFASDNTGPAHPEVIAALAEVNSGYVTGYGADTATEDAIARIREIFEAPDAAVFFVATGTAANSLLLATLSEPWSAIFCAKASHINEDECNGPEFFTGGAKLVDIDCADAKLTPETLRAAILHEEIRGINGPRRGPVSITQVTELGTIYSVAEIAALSTVAREFNLPVHMDGARFANALVALGCTPAEMTWKAGVDAVSFGATKNGCLGVEACIMFDPAKAFEFELRRKRGAALLSKHRYLAAQMNAYLKDDLWLNNAKAANRSAARLVAGLQKHADVRLVHPAQANLVFPEMTRDLHQRLMKAGAHYYLWGDDLEGDPDALLLSRMVCDWAITDEMIDQFLDLLNRVG